MHLIFSRGDADPLWPQVGRNGLVEWPTDESLPMRKYTIRRIDVVGDMVGGMVGNGDKSVLAEVADPVDQQELDSNSKFEIRWLHRNVACSRSTSPERMRWGFWSWPFQGL